MFSGIIESTGKVLDLKKEQSNLRIVIQSSFTAELKIDQSIAHNGVCLTVVSIQGNSYTVTAIDETLQKTNLGSLQIGDQVNLERCIKAGDRLDGHIVQGHVDQTGVCTSVVDNNGSWIFDFKYDGAANNITVEKGSICINGVSLTVVNSQNTSFSVCIIPYTFAHTNFHSIKVGSTVNLEFDILGKYISKLIKK
jgi:riboflavin synthase